MPWNTVRLDMSCFALMFSFSMVSRYSMLILLPPSIRTQENRAARLSYALVLDVTLATERRAARFSRILIDGGSSINILYRDTMEKLNLKAWEPGDGITSG